MPWKEDSHGISDEKGSLPGVFSIFLTLGENGVSIAPFAKICLVCIVIPNTCIDQELIVGLIHNVGNFPCP